MKIVHRIKYNSRSESCTVDEHGVEKIEYCPDQRCCKVYYDNKDEVQIFDLDEVVWIPEHFLSMFRRAKEITIDDIKRELGAV